ncbi:hypothetical protein HYW82_04405 [Candidatus Peregrinibacteria bacterium]|nr:hypothetical protein [Candidatus Peregrinibacteria bacterium]
MLFDASKIGDADESTVIESTKKIFKKHGFDVNDETKMNAITDRYTNNEEVSKLVENGLSKKCPGDVAEGLLDVSADTKTGEK